MIPPVPRVLLVGAGRFGMQHLAEWHRLASEGEIEFSGVVARDEQVRERIRQLYAVPVYAGLNDDLLRQVDAVDIVTPPGSHAELVRQCLPLAHVLVEKPLATDALTAAALGDLAAKHGRVLMVGHVFRFHPVVLELKRIVSGIPGLPRGIDGAMINPGTNPDHGQAGPDEANLELLHLFDVVDFLFEVTPEVVSGRRRGRLNHVSLRYPGPMNAVLRLGWEGERKVRRLQLVYPDQQVSADFIDNSVVISGRNNQLHKSFFPDQPQALREELRAFIAALRQPTGAHREAWPGAAVGERIVRIAEAARPQPARRRPRIAVIGGGIFGATCALELAKIGEVTLVERQAELLTETSANNQQRHHSGFHYPRSYDSIAEIRAARQAFEEECAGAIDRSFPAYYCTSATGVEIPADRYLAACQSNHLDYSIVESPPGIVDASAISLCLRTDEAVYDVARLREIVSSRLTSNPAVRCLLKTTVVSGVITNEGAKRLTLNGPGGTTEESFDYLVNATYAHRNLVAHWFGFPVEPLRFDLYEHLLLRLPIPQVCVTIMDGPFTSLTGTGRENLFLLSHIHDSVSRSIIPDDGMPPRWSGQVSNRANMLRHSSRYLPILAQAFDVQSRWTIRAVNAYARDFDARPTVISDHGFGCWSVLGGKVITSVANARDIAREIEREFPGEIPGPIDGVEA
jgi:predicted dehydrogenase/glycine/D-amino acid oxidase-like deaminating enzyme